MADEIFLSAPPGLSPLVQLYQGTTPVGSPFSLSAVALTGDYVGDMPAVSYGRYSILCYVSGSPDVKIASGQILWDGNFEMPVGLSMLQGLDPSNAMTVTPTSRVTGAIDLVISGDGITSSTVQRV